MYVSMIGSYRSNALICSCSRAIIRSMTSSSREGAPCSDAASLRAVLASGGADALGLAGSCFSAVNGFCAAKYDPPNDAQKKITGTKSFVRMLAPLTKLAVRHRSARKHAPCHPPWQFFQSPFRWISRRIYYLRAETPPCRQILPDISCILPSLSGTYEFQIGMLI